MTDTQSATRTETRDAATDDNTPGHTELTTRIEQLEAENRRLRRSIEDTRQHHYRGTATGLVAVGIVCGLIAFATNRSDVLFALAGIGLFSGVLTYYLTPNRVVAADVGDRIYAATAQSYEEICADLGLSDRRVYVPVGATTTDNADNESDESSTTKGSDVRLFVPQQGDMEIPDARALKTGSFIVENQSGTYGLSVHPTGSGLFAAFQTVLDSPLESDPQTLAQQLSDAVVEDFELVRSVATDVDPDQGRLSVRFVNPLYESRSGFDHPLVSFFAVGVAVGLDSPVETTITDTDPLSVTIHWETDATRADTAATRDQPTAQPSTGSG
jgi:hypothetical protein